MEFTGYLEVGLYIVLGFLVLLACFIILFLTYVRRKREGQPKRERKSTTGLVSPPRPEKESVQFFIPLSVETVPTLVQDSIREEDEAVNVENEQHSEVKGRKRSTSECFLNDDLNGNRLLPSNGGGSRVYTRQRSISLTNIARYSPPQYHATEAANHKRRPLSETLLLGARLQVPETRQKGITRSKRSQSSMCLLGRGSHEHISYPIPPTRSEDAERRKTHKTRPFSDTFIVTTAVQPAGPPKAKGAVDRKAALQRRMTETSYDLLSRHGSIEHLHNIKRSLVSSVQTSPALSRRMRRRRSGNTDIPADITGRLRNQPLTIQSASKPLGTEVGRLTFSLAYSKEENKLELHFLNATDLPMRNNALVDSYAIVSLVAPTKKQGRETKVHKKTCNPIFDEKYVFKNVCEVELLKSHLKFEVRNRLSNIKSELLGEVVVQLSEEGLFEGKQLSRNLVTKVSRKECQGEILISICHKATSAELSVTVAEIRGLKQSFLSAPRVSVELIRSSATLNRQWRKTSVTYDKPFTFPVATDSSRTLQSFSLLFKVYYHDIIRGDDVIGHVKLAKDARLQSEIDHWSAVASSPHQFVARWHKLHE